MGAKIKTKVYLLIVCLPLALTALFVTFLSTATPVMAAAGVNSQLSFEGKIVKSDGTNIADGTYNMEFKLYQDGTNTGSGSTLKWTEDYLVAGSTGMPSTGGVTLSSGTFQVNLGSICGFTGGTCGAKTNAGVDWNQDTLWLSMQIGNSSACTVTSSTTSFALTGAGNCNGDGEMSPFIRLTAVPQAQVAQQANTLGGTLTAANFLQLAQGLQTDASTTNPSIGVNKTGGTANIITLQRAGSPVLVLDTSGALTLTPTGNNIGTTIRQTSGTATSGNIFDIQGSNGTSHFIQITETAANAGSISLTSLGSNSLTLDAGGGTIILGGNTTTLQKGGSLTLDLSSAATNTLTVSNSNGSNVASISATGDIAVGTGRVFKVGATSGSSISACSSTQFVSSFASTGGIVTAGGCTAHSLQTSYNGGATIALASSPGGVLIQDNGTPVGGNLFAVQKSSGTVTYLGVTATGINIQSNATGSAVSALAFDTTTTQPHLKIYGANGTNYADIYYDSSTSTAYYGANTGTAVLGSGTGAVNVTAGAGAAFVITGNATSSISTTAGNISIAPAAVLTLQGGTTASLLSTTSSTVTVDSGTTGDVNIGVGANAKTTTIGSANTTSTTNIQSGSGNINLIPGAGNDVVYSQGAGSQLQLAASAATTVDQLAITNAGHAVTTNNANGLGVNYTGGAAAVEAAGMRVDFTPGGTSGGTWSGLRIVANATGAASGVTEYGLKLEGPTSPGSGTQEAAYIGTGWDIGLDIQSGGIQLSDMANPAAPPSGNLRLYAKNVAGRMLLKAEGSSGVDYPLQPSFFQNQISIISNIGGTSCVAAGFNGIGLSITGLATSNTCSSTVSEQYGYMKNIATAATTSIGSYVYSTDAYTYRGSISNGANGFFFNARIALPDTTANYTGNWRTFLGLTDRATTVPTATDNPAGVRVGFSFVNAGTGRADTNWQVSTKNGTTETLTNTGLAFAGGKVYDVYLYCPLQCTAINWRIDDITDQTSAQDISTGITSNLPTATTAMRPYFGQFQTTAVAHNIRLNRIYVESDR